MAKREKLKRDEPKRPLHFLREWREYRGFSQEKLGEIAGTDKTVISLIENGHRKLSDKWARKLAPILGIQAGWLLDYDPNDLDTDLIEVWASVPTELRGQALRTLKSFALANAKKTA